MFPVALEAGGATACLDEFSADVFGLDAVLYSCPFLD